mmetsp:Transcript_897/g.1222  ORF Transcript_897/g.1222 Transcript_897/m.1222 type:complete len:1115 (-) Transcript_897:41-3385(-)
MEMLSFMLGILITFAHANGPPDPPPSASEIESWQWAWNERRLTERKYWRHDTSQKPPYLPPKGWIYNTSAAPVEGKINVHIVPHTHDDTGWQVTVDQYFFNEVAYILDTVVRQLNEDSNRRFMYVETGFFARWWDQQTDVVKNITRALVKDGRLEFINGGWCMHDEASPYYQEMIDQTTRGHQFLLKEFGSSGNPKGTWQIDPFGHSNTQAWLLSAEAGMGSLFWGRMDYLDGNVRLKNKGLEWIWRGSQSLGKSAEIFAGEIYGTNGGFGYSCPMGFDGSDRQIQDNPKRHDYNVDQQIEEFLGYVFDQAAHTKDNHIMWACGGDFNYQNAAHWYKNLDKLIHYANLNGTVNVLYSTPSFYVEQKNKGKTKWEVREDDIFPLADDAHHYWTGYFVSRPALKRQVRFASNLLNAARQMETISGVTAKEVDLPTVRPSPEVGIGWTDSLEGTIGVATHHDGMSGTERQDVADDYEQRISESQVEVEAGIVASLQTLLGTNLSSSDFSHCGCAQMDTCLNMSMCSFTAEANNGFTVIAWSPLSQDSVQYVRIPVTETNWKVTELATTDTVESQLVPIDDITHNLPLLYINYYGLSPAEIKAKEEEYRNKATHVLVFAMKLPAFGYNTYSISPGNDKNVIEIEPLLESNMQESTTESVSNGIYRIDYDTATGQLKTLTKLSSNISTTFSIEWGWYNSSTGGCTKEIPGPPASEEQCDDQHSGAYIFRPNSSQLFYPGPQQTPKLTVTKGPLVTEIKQVFSDWASHVVRLYAGMEYVEVEWTAGPIPMETPWLHEPDLGKEVVIKYSSSLKSKGVFYTDSNGREMVKRIRDGRGPSYPQPLNISEPVAGNYYPINAMVALEDEAANVQLTVITDVAQGAASLQDGNIEIMVHRRVLEDDARGVQEPLNETMCGCNDINAPPGQMGAHGHLGDGGCECAGLTVRGRHWLVLGDIKSTNMDRRLLDTVLQFPATLTFATKDVANEIQTPRRSFISKEPPANLRIMTLTNNYAHISGGKTLLRVAHLYSVGEHPTLSLPAKLSIDSVFSEQGLNVKSVEETSLTGNQPLKQLDDEKLVWKTYEPWNYSHPKSYEERKYMAKDGFVVEIRPMEVRSFWVTFS